MATRQQALDAAKKKPSARTAHEQGIVDANQSDQAVRNADYDARKNQSVYGPG